MRVRAAQYIIDTSDPVQISSIFIVLSLMSLLLELILLFESPVHFVRRPHHPHNIKLGEGRGGGGRRGTRELSVDAFGRASFLQCPKHFCRLLQLIALLNLLIYHIFICLQLLSVYISDCNWDASSVSFPRHVLYYFEFICLFQVSCICSCILVTNSINLKLQLPLAYGAFPFAGLNVVAVVVPVISAILLAALVIAGICYVR